MTRTGGRRASIKYKNQLFRRTKNTHLLEISCGKCKVPVAMYEKAGKGNLIKIHIGRIIESEMNLQDFKGHLTCPYCNFKMARRGRYKGSLVYWAIRGRINTRRVD